jgi:ATP-GRASP peptide maturase of grasp-with-spasm system
MLFKVLIDIMVIIQSQDFEISTNAIIDWLIFFKKPYIKLMQDDVSINFKLVSITEDGYVDFRLKVGDKEIKLSEITAYWHRRGATPLKVFQSKKVPFLKKILGNINFRNAVINLHEERKHLSAFLGLLLTKLPIKIGDPNNSTLNKLSVLYHAASLGIKISPTFVTGKKDVVKEHHKLNSKIITKSISDNLHTNSPTDTFMFYTEKITEHVLNGLPDEFYYSLFQSEIVKKYEVRSFYLHGNFYSMAIFSQNDTQTEVDFRKYNNDKPNRMVPFKLPLDIEQKLDKLMRLMRLDSGSIDIIVSEKNEFYFLEINPVGQFGMVSQPCNYFIERHIATYLTSGQISSNQ